MNLIGISGKKNSGKDTVARMLMYLHDYEVSGYTFPITIYNYHEWLIHGHLEESPIQRKQYADKIKDTLCNWIGCTRKQFEDRKFKETPLGEQWWCWKVYWDKNFEEFDLIPYRGEDNVYQALKDSDPPYAGHQLVKTTPRLLMQLLGTDCGREIIHPNIWVNAVFSDYKPERKRTPLERITQGITEGRDVEDEDFPKWIITDVRFPNELKAIKHRGGKLIRINRQCRAMDLDNAMKREIGTKEHPSETSLDDYDNWDMVIWNREGLAELLTEVRTFHDKNKWD